MLSTGISTICTGQLDTIRIRAMLDIENNAVVEYMQDFKKLLAGIGGADMRKEYFIEKLEEGKMGLQESKKFWKKRIEEIFTYLLEENEKEDGAVEYLKQFIDFEDKSVLDVGFGTGKHLRLMAKEGADLLCGVEMSEQMIEYAKNSFVENGMNIEQMGLHNIPWQEIDLDKLGWRNKFDLVFASKSPALDSYESIKKLISASKKGIFLATHVAVEEDVQSEIYKEIHGRAFDPGKRDFWYLFNILYLDGHYPNIKIEETKQRAEYPVDALVSRYAPRIFSGKPDKNDLDKLKKLAGRYETDGMVAITITRKVALIYFEK